jgi:hypothetical protein
LPVIFYPNFVQITKGCFLTIRIGNNDCDINGFYAFSSKENIGNIFPLFLTDCVFALKILFDFFSINYPVIKTFFLEEK